MSTIYTPLLYLYEICNQSINRYFDTALRKNTSTGSIYLFLILSIQHSDPERRGGIAIILLNLVVPEFAVYCRHTLMAYLLKSEENIEIYLTQTEYEG
jgi:hypothetical protein